MNSLSAVNEKDVTNRKPPETEEERLVSAARNGNSAAFESLVTRSRRLVMAIARRMTGNPDLAEDLTQQAYMKAYKNLSGFGGRCTFSTWVVSIAVNEARMWNRKARRSREVSITDLCNGETLDMPELEFSDWRPDPESTCSENEWSRLLFSAMEHLPPGMRETLKICDIEEQSAMTAAVLLGITVNAVKSRRLRGRLALRRELEFTLSPRKARSGSSTGNQVAQSSGRRRVSRTRSGPRSPKMARPAAEERFHLPTAAE